MKIVNLLTLLIVELLSLFLAHHAVHHVAPAVHKVVPVQHHPVHHVAHHVARPVSHGHHGAVAQPVATQGAHGVSVDYVVSSVQYVTSRLIFLVQFILEFRNKKSSLHCVHIHLFPFD